MVTSLITCVHFTQIFSHPLKFSLVIKHDVTVDTVTQNTSQWLLSHKATWFCGNESLWLRLSPLHTMNYHEQVNYHWHNAWQCLTTTLTIVLLSVRMSEWPTFLKNLPRIARVTIRDVVSNNIRHIINHTVCNSQQEKTLRYGGMRQTLVDTDVCQKFNLIYVSAQPFTFYSYSYHYYKLQVDT